mmetsp:Transcript_35927/g.86831  ORF Transcript_35927/g.86831 Transcript_35927/m.86831 type:complete len:144 (-) Transcript_35927:1311-1742(-)
MNLKLLWIGVNSRNKRKKHQPFGTTGPIHRIRHLQEVSNSCGEMRNENVISNYIYFSGAWLAQTTRSVRHVSNQTSMQPQTATSFDRLSTHFAMHDVARRTSRGSAQNNINSGICRIDHPAQPWYAVQTNCKSLVDILRNECM